jgi:predicted O-methyltransferase YrrM
MKPSMYELDWERGKLTDIMNLLGLTGMGVEVGVDRGFFSSIILENSKLKTLVSIDVWKDEEILVEAARELGQHGSRSVMLRGRSPQSASFFPDSSLDFVYIDANHSYNYVKKDILGWWPKVRRGGMFAGHDYMPFWRDKSGVDHKYGVIEAVDELVVEHGQKLNLIGTWKSWWIIKDNLKITCL